MKPTNQPSTPAPKYCQTCGRLISPTHRNFADRKYCSKSCGGSRPTAVDLEIEALFMELARKKGSVECGEVERLFVARKEEGGEEGREEGLGHKEGLERAKWRERVRRAGRRVVVFGSGGDRFECVQGGKVVEPSFAKGEWAVRLVMK